MSLKTFTTHLDSKTLKALKALSAQTGVSESELVREGIGLMLRRHAENMVNREIRTEIRRLLKEDSSLLKRLARA